MRRLTISKGNKIIHLDINKIKVIYGFDYPTSYELYETIKSYFSNMEQSEYSEYNNCNLEIKLDNKLIDTKKTFFFELEDGFMCNEDLKLSSKSLTVQYLTHELQKIDYYDTIHSINLLLQSLATEISNNLDIIKVNIPDLNIKQIIKLCEVYMIKEELILNQYDLNYEEKILFQLTMLKPIIESLHKDQYIVILNLPIITSTILNALNNVNNGLFIIFTLHNHSLLNLEDYFLLGKNFSIDLANDNDIYYNICLHNNKSWTLMEGKQYMKDFLENKDTCEVRFIKSIIK